MRNIFVRCAILAALAGGLPAAASAQTLKLSMQDGRVTLIAENVPLRQILQEWARVGQTKIVNAEKLSGPMMSIQLVNAPERDALDILLRSAAGYIAAPRPAAVANAAYYDRITILATSRAPAVSASVAPAPAPFQRPPQQVDDDEPINVAMPPPPGASPAAAQFPGMPPTGQPATAAQPGPLTSPRPGALPAPPNPMPTNPYQPGQIIRPPGSGGPGGPGGPGGE